MIPSKLASKKSKKRKNSSQNSSDSYEDKKMTKLRKMSKTNKKQSQKQSKRKSEKNVSDKYNLHISSQSQQNKSQKHQQVNTTQLIPLQIFNAGKIFTEILNKASKEPQFLIMLKNLLSGCSRTLGDKKNMYKKKWKQLRNSNCSQDEYISRQGQLKRSELEEVHQIEKDIMTKLSFANIKGFQTRNSLIQNYKRQIGLSHSNKTKQHQNKIQEQGKRQIDFEIDDQNWQKYYEEQRKLLDLLMKENDFVSQDYTPSNLIKTYSQAIKEKQNAIKDQVYQNNQLGQKFNNLQTEQNPEAAQFLFCKHFKDIDYDRVFQHGMASFKPHQNEKFYIQPKAMSWLLQTKSDQIYTNEKFQKETYNKYCQLLRQIYEKPENYSDSQILSYLLQVGAYILNSVHYYQKFKLKCDLLHPLDIMLTMEKVKEQRKKITSNNNKMDQQKYQKIEQQILKINERYQDLVEQY